jgi:uncharacterized protein YecE (DUF72 family)
LTEYRVGAGGWAYFQVPGMDSLTSYSKAFNFVEVNSTFYETPPAKMVASWREKVPTDFEFSVRLHRDLSHNYGLEPVKESHRVLQRDVEICRTLHSSILQLETPQGLKITRRKATAFSDLLASSDTKGIRIAWEIRSVIPGKQLPDYLARTMQDLNMIHCVDLSREDPAYTTDVGYSRLFGKGKYNIYQFDDKELTQIHKKVKEGKEKKVVLSFHGLKMYLDAARFKVYNESLKLPPVTKSVGLSSLREVLSEDARFPMTKEQLMQRQGWKVIDLTPSERVHSTEILKRLNNKTYGSIDDVVNSLAREMKTEDK